MRPSIGTLVHVKDRSQGRPRRDGLAQRSGIRLLVRGPLRLQGRGFIFSNRDWQQSRHLRSVCSIRRLCGFIALMKNYPAARGIRLAKSSKRLCDEDMGTRSALANYIPRADYNVTKQFQ